MLIDRMPAMGSQVAEARRDDPEMVERVLSLVEDEMPPWRPQATDWTLRDELTASMFDRLGVLIAVEQARGSGKRPKVPPPFPRPVRAVDLARSAAEAEYLAELDDEVRAAQERWRAQQAENADRG